MLFVALLSIVTLSSALPGIVELAMGLSPRDPEFGLRWETFLGMFAAHLADGEKQ